ncbi:MAG: U32 family peptidase, partial [Peptoniphilaceae bacterium]|nr:U32 family peptidase [Peptoniphilaceae bacterium]
MSEIEILAPVGNDDMAIAALNANADAIYVGLDDFGARAYAKNFTLDNIEALIDKMHLFGKKVYITLNTLIKDSEIEKIFFYSKKLYEMGADAFIIQDIGLFKILKKHFKNIEFHASTQMAVNDIYGAKYLKDIGFSRIVIARETPIEEIKKITQIGIETEVFVHGALCVSFSGQCYMSSFLGQRSANRGRCAGPCRKLYELSRENGKKITDTSDYFLSMKDLCTIDRINDLLDAGIKSFKIEGRMKSKEYVFESVKNYKNAINNRNINKEGLVDVSNRGYSSGFIFDQNDNYIDLKENYGHRVVGKIEKNNGINYIKFFSKIYKDSILQIITNKGKKLPYTATKNYEKGEKIDLINFNDAKINSDVLMLNSSKISYDLKENEGLKKRNINFKFKSKIGKFPKLILSYKNYNIVINSKIKTEKSKNFSIDDNYVINSLSKTNSTIYKAKEIEIEIEDGSFIPKKEINSLRRKSIESLNEKIFKSYKRISNAEYKSYPKENKSVIKEVNLELINSEYDLELLKMADNIYFYKFNDILSGFDNLYFVISPFIKYDFKKLINFLI